MIEITSDCALLEASWLLLLLQKPKPMINYGQYIYMIMWQNTRIGPT